MISDELLLRAIVEVDQAILDMLPDPSECTHNFSEAFQKKIKKLIHKADHIVVYRVLRHVASILIAIILSGTVFLAVNTEARAAVMDWVKERFEGIYAYFFVGEEDKDEPSSYSPDWLPDGYILLDSFTTENGETYIYANESMQMLQFAYSRGHEKSPVAINVADFDHKYINIDNFRAEVFIPKKPDEAKLITWETKNGKAFCSISGLIKEEELVRMAQNITPKN